MIHYLTKLLSTLESILLGYTNSLLAGFVCGISKSAAPYSAAQFLAHVQLELQQVIQDQINPPTLEKCAKGIRLCNLLRSTQPNDRETVIEG